jgi:hypothetical protein
LQKAEFNYTPSQKSKQTSEVLKSHQSLSEIEGAHSHSHYFKNQKYSQSIMQKPMSGQAKISDISVKGPLTKIYTSL